MITPVKNLLKLSIIALICFFFQACSSSLTSNLPMVKGKANEVVIVADLAVWDSPSGDTLRRVFGEAFPGLPQEEPYFSMVHKDPLGFIKSSLLKEHRNVCRIQIADTLTSQLLVSEDVWATPQLVVDIKASSPDSLIAILLREKTLIRQIFKQKEQKRSLSIYNRTLHQDLQMTLEKEHYVSLTIPRGWNLDINKKDFAWVSMQMDRENIQLGLLIWHYPYTDEKQFAKKELLIQRNKVLKENVPGPEAGSYMATDTLNYETIYEPIMHKGNYYVWMRGLWYTENYLMGGPFVSLSTYSKQAGQIITVDAFVYAPQKEKRNYIRQLEAILSSMKVDFPSEKTDSTSFIPSSL